MQQRFPQAGIFLLGFSLGSFLIRDYLMTYSKHNLLGTILIGTGDQPSAVLKIIKGILKLEMRKLQPGESSDLVRNLSFTSYNNKFKPNQTRADWLSSNLQAVERYIEDPLCRPDVSADLLYEMLDSMERTGNTKNIARDDYAKHVPTLILAGEQDPVGNMGEGVKVLKKKLDKAGYQDVTLRMFPNARHDLLHETSETVELVVTQLRQWVCDHCCA